MLLQESPSLEELVLETLVDRPGATAAEIKAALLSRGLAYSLRGIYKELDKLIEQGVVFKRKTSYNIHLTWIMKLLAFGDKAFERYTNNPYLVEMLKGDSIEWRERFNDLGKLDRLWTQLILALHELNPGKMMCFWCPCQWFPLAQPYVTKQFYEAIDLTAYKRLHIIGSDTYLNRRALKDLPKNGTYSFSESPFHKETSTYYTVVGDFLITVKLHRLISEKLMSLFESVATEEDLQLVNLRELFSKGAKATLICEKNEQKANRIKKKFANYFGMEIG